MSSIKELKCGECHASFLYQRMLQSHIVKKHLKNGNIACAECCKVLPKENQMRKHFKNMHPECEKPRYIRGKPKSNEKIPKENETIEIEANESTLSTTKPNESVSSRSQFNTSNEKDELQSCPVCKENFNTLINLFSHCIDKHEDNFLMCGFCSLVFADDKDLIQHSKSTHSKDEASIDIFCLKIQLILTLDF